MSTKSRSRSARRHNPLADDLVATGNLRVKSNKRKAKPEGEEDRFVDSRSSRKILKIGQELVDEDRRDSATAAPNPAFAFESRFGDDSEPENDLHPDEEQDWGDDNGEDVVEEVVSLMRKVTPYVA